MTDTRGTGAARLVALMFLLAAWPAIAAEPAPAPIGPTRELTRYVEARLKEPAAAPDETWSFGVTADPHIYMYGWADARLAASLRGWTKAGAKFAVVVGDLGTGTSLRPEKTPPKPKKPAADPNATPPTPKPPPPPIKMIRQMDRFANTIKSVPGCPPVIVSMGNHELDGDGKKAWLDALYPNVVPPIKGSGNDRFFYYSFDYRGCHFVSLDANHIPSTGRRRAVLGVIPDHEFAWLEKDLQANKGKLTFVFLHEPIEQVHYDTPYYLLKNRGRLISLLRRFPDVKWIFHGHLHYANWVTAWGLNIVHCGNWTVRVKGQKAELVPKKPPYDLGAVLAARVLKKNGAAVYQLAETAIERPGRGCSLKKHVTLVRTENGVKPTSGDTMMKIQLKLGARGKQSFTHLTRYLSTWDVLPIVKGMKLSYDVRCVNSVYDNLALDLRIVMPKGRKLVPLKDQNGILMQNVHLYHSPSLQGKADKDWYHREVDLSPLAGGWIDMVTLCTTRPNDAPYPAGELCIYLDNIRFTWPADDAPRTTQ